jgi:hypothetical protein
MKYGKREGMMRLAPIIMKVAFICPECVKKQTANVEVLVVEGKSCFAFMCEKCMASWIMEVFEANWEKTKKLPPGTIEPQTQIFVKFTSELQPLMKKKAIDSLKIRFLKSIGKTTEVQPLGGVNLNVDDLSGCSGSMAKTNQVKASFVKMKIGNRGIKK